jgi:hypothetical protein
MFRSALALAALLAAPAALANPNAPLAEKLFLEAQSLLKAGKVHEACDRLAESHKLDPALGTLINLAACHEKEGKTASAWTEFSEAAALAAHRKEHDREKFARDHATALEGQLLKLMIEITAQAPGLEVKLDGATLSYSAFGTEIPLDPGDHSLTVTAPGKKPWLQRVNLGPGRVVTRVQVPVLEDEGTPAPAPPSPPPAVMDHRAPLAPPPPAKPGPPASAYVVGGVGLLAVGGAAFFGVRSILLDERSREQLDPAMARADHDDAKTHQLVAFGLGGAGVVALGVATYLFFSPRKPVQVAPSVGGVTVFGRF